MMCTTADERPFCANERLECFLTGVFIQDNLGDIEAMLRDIHEWPLGSQAELNLRLPIEMRFEALSDAIKSKECVCLIHVSMKAEIDKAAKLFRSTNYRDVEELLQSVQNSYQNLAENSLGKNRV